MLYFPCTFYNNKHQISVSQVEIHAPIFAQDNDCIILNVIRNYNQVMNMPGGTLLT